MSPAVSVVIPTHNRRGRTRRAIESALKQTLKPLEIIVVDDGSALPFEFDHPHVRVLRHEERRGAGAARNRGVDAASGEWVAFLDSDDRWLPDKLERQFSCRDEGQAPSLCFCNVLVLESEGARGRPYNVSAPSGDLSEWILIGFNTAQTSGLMMPTDDARRIRFDESLERHQDWDIFLRGAESGLSLSYVHEPLVLYDAWRPDRISASGTTAETIAWINKASVRPLISGRARHAALCRHAASFAFAERPLTASMSLARALMRREIRFGPTLGWLMRALGRLLRTRSAKSVKG